MEGLSVWTDARWRASFDAWIDEALRDAGERRTGPLEVVHVRPWSTVVRTTTDHGIRFAKAGASTQRHEPALLVHLAILDPGLLPEVIAVRPDAGWSITADGGPLARDLPERDAVLEAMEAVLPRYAELQAAAAPSLAAMLAAGTPDRRADATAAALRRGLTDRSIVEGTFDEALASCGTEELVSRLPELHDALADLEAGPIPVSIQHDDLHDANIFVGHGGRILDWGDAVIGHPFASLLGIEIALENRFEMLPGAPEAERLRRAYLEPWGTYGSVAELESIARRAIELNAASRLLSWGRIMAVVPRAEIDNEAAVWARELLGVLRRADR
jgi:hypothetical protein